MKQSYIFLNLLYMLIFICFSPSLLAQPPSPQIYNLIIHGTPSAIKALINNKNINLETRDKFQRTPIHISINKQDIETTKLFIKKGVNINTQDMNGWTPIHVAAKTGNAYLLQLIIDANANLDLRDKFGRNAFLLGVHGTRINEVQKGYINIIQALAKHKPELLNSVDEKGDTGLHIASKIGDTPMVEALIRLGANTQIQNQYQNLAVHIAITQGHMAIVRIFAKHNPALFKTTLHSKTVFHIAAYYNHPKMIQELIAMGFGSEINKTNNLGWSPFLTSIKNGYFQTAQQFINHDKTSVHQKLSDLKTAAHIVVIEASKSKDLKWTKMMNWLVELGIDVQAKDNKGMTAYDLEKHIGETNMFPVLSKKLNKISKETLTLKTCKETF